MDSQQYNYNITESFSIKYHFRILHGCVRTSLLPSGTSLTLTLWLLTWTALQTMPKTCAPSMVCKAILPWNISAQRRQRKATPMRMHEIWRPSTSSWKELQNSLVSQTRVRTVTRRIRLTSRSGNTYFFPLGSEATRKLREKEQACLFDTIWSVEHVLPRDSRIEDILSPSRGSITWVDHGVNSWKASSPPTWMVYA